MKANFGKKQTTLECVELGDPSLRNEFDAFPADKNVPGSTTKYNFNGITSYYCKMGYGDLGVGYNRSSSKIPIFKRINI